MYIVYVNCLYDLYRIEYIKVDINHDKSKENF